jgi:hypothetical protein
MHPFELVVYRSSYAVSDCDSPSLLEYRLLCIADQRLERKKMIKPSLRNGNFAPCRHWWYVPNLFFGVRQCYLRDARGNILLNGEEERFLKV